MRIKGLAKSFSILQDMIAECKEKLDNLDPSSPDFEEHDDRLNDCLLLLCAARDAVGEVSER